VFRGLTDGGLCSIAATILLLDFLVWGYIPFVVVRPPDAGVRVENLAFLL
jgi:hypothetical protein